MINSITGREGHLTFKPTTLTKEESEHYVELYERFCGLFILVTQPATDLADSAARDAIVALKKAGMYKQSVKRNARASLTSLDTASAMMHKRLHEAQTGDQNGLYLDYLDVAQDGIEKHVEILRFTLAQFALNKGWKHSNVCGYMFLADALFSLATDIFTHFFKKASELGSATVVRMLRHTFGFANPLPAARWWSVALVEFDKNYNIGIGLPNRLPEFWKDEHVQTAYRIVYQTLMNIEKIDKDGDTALALSSNPT